jgi:dimethylaniline monooxygenase (N-oxide forming)
MKIAVVGAGFAGLSTAKVLREFDHEVVVFDKAPDVGGVWSVTRRYPGVRTQNNKDSYALPGLPMPRSYPEWPTGAQVQAYLERYVEKFGLGPSLRLGTEVTRATPSEEGWEVTAGSTIQTFGHLVVANGIYSDPFIPPFEGVDVLESAGGRLLAPCDFHDLARARGKHVVVVGYGKSSCDISTAISQVAASTTIIARELQWKLPRKLKGVSFKYLMLTRLGERLFRYRTVAGAESFLRRRGHGARRRMLDSVDSVATRQFRLPELGLVPDGTFEDIDRSTVSLATEGFYEAIADGRISVLRNSTIHRFLKRDRRPYAELADGTTIPADLVVSATGFRRQVPFFDEAVRKRLTDGQGNFELYRQILPHDVPHLTFAGYNPSLFSPLSAAMSAVWIASHLAGLHQVPSVEERRRLVARLAWAEKQGTNIVPPTMHNIDEVLSDLGLNIGKGMRAWQWLLPVNPTFYRTVTKKLKKRYQQASPPVTRSIRNCGTPGDPQALAADPAPEAGVRSMLGDARALVPPARRPRRVGTSSEVTTVASG